MRDKVNKLVKEFSSKSEIDLLRFFLKEYGNRIALASSLSIEDQVLTDMILKINSSARIFVIDTGRLHQETYDVLAETIRLYPENIEVYFPDTGEVENMIKKYGPNLFYESAKLRKMCCEIRKVKPLHRVQRSLDCWITGLRREQSKSRLAVREIEFDETSHIIKLNPIAYWTIEMVWEYIRVNELPYNFLYDRHYKSIGCVPCTRPVMKGEDIRSGRWWWEKKNTKECGMHM
ncbi:MAG: phosphoadenylyl-sulfate reductase [Spirochaetes bacterium]|nr:phosphoadenylyl-sulfate reductase [Spirochaetota bacterium]